MPEYSGKSVFGGIAIGRIKVIQNKKQHVKKFSVRDVDMEMERFEHARDEASNQLLALYEQARITLGQSSASIFEMHRIMVLDEEFRSLVLDIIKKQSVNAEYAIFQATDRFLKKFSQMENGFMRERALDLEDVSERLLRVLSKKEQCVEKFNEPVIIVAKDLTPSETVQLDKDMIAGLVTVAGSIHSHTAILARTMGIPALVQTKIMPEKTDTDSFARIGTENDKDVKTNEEWDRLLESMDGQNGVLDGNQGIFYVSASKDQLQELSRKKEQYEKQKKLYDALKGKENITLDGKKIRLNANVAGSRDLGVVLANEADGIGLFRSEFLYMEKDSYPTEEEQFQIYKNVAETMSGKQVVFRTLDIGGDKQCEYIKLGKEENPALGLRGIRFSLTYIDIFKTQLRALFRACCHGNISIMYPMITSLSEIQRIKEVVLDITKELDEEQIPYKIPAQGIMVETPAAVMISDLLANEVDFLSIGTNDLVQYTLAMDRQNGALEDFYDPHHEALLRMIKLVVENGHKAGIEVGICGELGADTLLTAKLLQMGVDEFSVAPGSILSIRKTILETNVKEKYTT